MNFERVLNLDERNNFFIRVLMIFNEQRSLNFINIMYRRKIFRCFECAILTYKLISNVDKKLIVGAKNEAEFVFHAWVEDNSGIVFGHKSDLDQYKAIIKI